MSIENQRDDISLGIGPLTRNTIKVCWREGKSIKQKSISSLMQYEPSVCEPTNTASSDFHSTILFSKIVYLLISRSGLKCLSHIEQTVTHFTLIHEALVTDASMFDAVEEQFMDYQAMCETDIPKNIWEAAQVGDIRDQQYRMDVIWGYLKPKLPHLQRLLYKFL